MFTKNISLQVFCLSLLIVIDVFAQNKSIEVIAPDNSVKMHFSSKGYADAIFINGSWNRIKQDLSISDRNNELYGLDFNLGTYTDLITNHNRPIYNITQKNSNEITLETSVRKNNQNITVIRTIVFSSNGQVNEKLVLRNNSDQSITLDNDGIAFSFSSLFDISRITTNNSNIPEYQYFTDEKLMKASISGGSWFGAPKIQEFIQNIKWLTIADNFFLVIVQPNFENSVAVYHGLEFGSKSRVNIGIQALATNIAPRNSISYDLQYYIGPRQESIVTKIDKSYKKLFAWPLIFNWILKPIELGTQKMMSFVMAKTGSTGLTLILIAILVKLLLLPLSIKSAISMKKMRVLQPKLNKLQEKWGHDPQTLQMKTMELYKSEKANPLGGCLPLLLQIPVFFALFRVLSRSVDLRGAGFLWMTDLTSPDALFIFGTFTFNLLPIVMTILQIVSVYLQQGRMGNSQNEMQKQMQTQSYFMPLIFLFLFWNMPSGLVLYWTVQNIFSIIEQEFINLDSRIAKKTY